jgi:hypothetical protein
MEDQQLREIVGRLKDKADILECIHRYTRGLDRHDEKITITAYHDDAIDCHGTHYIGPAKEFVPWVNGMHAAAYRAHQHFITNHTADIDGDVAHCESYVFHVLRRHEGPTVDLGGGRYIDTLERRNGEWRIAVRHVVIDWFVQADGSVIEKVLALYPEGRQDLHDLSYARPLMPSTARDHRNLDVSE